LLSALNGILDKGLAHCEAKKIDPAALLTARLYPDMLPFNAQVAAAVRQAIGALEALNTGKVTFAPPTVPSTFPELTDLVTQTIGKLDQVNAAEINSLESREVVFEIPNFTMRFTAVSFITSMAMTNFAFHVTTAYAILRHNGVELGKRDFLGPLQLKP
jgi:hypothetical protein